jgi:twinkle protein
MTLTWESLNINTRGKTSGKHKTQCPKCGQGKRDADLSIDLDNGLYKCHKPSCYWHKGGTLKIKSDFRNQDKVYKRPEFNNQTNISDKVVQWFQKRGISQKTLIEAKITEAEEYMPQAGKKLNTIQFNYFRNGELINIKFRDGNKNFKLVSGAELILFNLDSMKDKDYVIITEGEIDALSFIEAGYDSVVSVPNGASSGNASLEYLSNCYKYFDNVKRIYIATDGDEPGRVLCNELCRRFGKDRSYIIEYPDNFKDANEVLVAKGVQEVKRLIEHSKCLPLDDVFYLDTIRNDMVDGFINGKQRGTTTYFKSLDPHFTWKKGDLILMGGIPNHGKTTIILQLMLIKSVHEGSKWAVFSPENFPPTEFYDDLIHSYIGKPVDPYYKESQMTIEEYQEGMDFIGKHFFYIYPENDSHTPDFINKKIQELIIREGIDGCLIDPWNQLDHDMSHHSRDDLYLSHILSKEKRFALKHDIYKITIAHPKTLKKKTDKSGMFIGYDCPDPYDLNGGAMWNNKMDDIMAGYRPNFYTDITDTTVEIHVQKIKKQKLVGIPGVCTLKFDRRSNRYLEYDIISPLATIDVSGKEFKLNVVNIEFDIPKPLNPVDFRQDEDEDDDYVPF